MVCALHYKKPPRAMLPHVVTVGTLEPTVLSPPCELGGGIS